MLLLGLFCVPCHDVKSARNRRFSHLVIRVGHQTQGDSNALSMQNPHPKQGMPTAMYPPMLAAPVDPRTTSTMPRVISRSSKGPAGTRAKTPNNRNKTNATNPPKMPHPTQQPTAQAGKWSSMSFILAPETADEKFGRRQIYLRAQVANKGKKFPSPILRSPTVQNGDALRICPISRRSRIRASSTLHSSPLPFFFSLMLPLLSLILCSLPAL